MRQERGPLERIEVDAAGGAYPVLVGRGGLAELAGVLRGHAPAVRYAVISDATVAGLYGAPALEAARAVAPGSELLTFPPGEPSKTRATWSGLTDAMLERGFGRDAVVVALGGGVTGDLAGFVAATYLRGVPVVQVPTSLVAMIDSAVGGKTGVDVPAGKNLVGAFHAPRAVVVDPDVTATLPVRERAQGLAEAVKHALILDAGYLERIESEREALLAGEPGSTEALVLRSVELKASVVREDERERGRRAILNFGHTIGHALEAASELRLPHGSAVAAGMVLEAVLGERLGVTREGTSRRIRAVLDPLGLLDRERVPTDADRILGHLAADKKSRASEPRLVLLEEPGRVAGDGGWTRTVPAAELRRVIEEVDALL